MRRPIGPKLGIVGDRAADGECRTFEGHSARPILHEQISPRRHRAGTQQDYDGAPDHHRPVHIVRPTPLAHTPLLVAVVLQEVAVLVIVVVANVTLDVL